MISFQRSGLDSAKILCLVSKNTPADPPATLTSMSIWPKMSIAVSANCFASLKLRTSTFAVSVLYPFFVNSSAIFFAASKSTSAINSLAPSCVNNSQVSRPIPPAPPVTMATLSA
jgi:hypothetical protein